MAGGPLAGFLGAGNVAGFADLFLGGLGAWSDYLKDAEGQAQNIDAMQGYMDLAAGTGNELMPQSANLGKIGDVYLPYNAVGDLLNFQNSQTQQAYSNFGNQQTRFNDYYNTVDNATQQAQDKVLGSFDQGSKYLTDLNQNRTNSVMNLYGENMQPAMQGLQDRYTRGMANLQGMGDQAKKDINTRYDANRGSIQQSLSARGLGNSTILDSMNMGNERERGGELGRLDESLRQQRLSTDASLSGDVANAQQNFANNNTQLFSGLTGDNMNLANGMFGNRMNIVSNQAGQNLSNTANQAGGWMDLFNNFDNSMLNFNAGIGQNRMNLGNNANANILGAISGANYGYGDNSGMNAAMNALGGLGSFSGTQDAMNIQDKQFEQAMTMGAITGGLGMTGLPQLGGSFMGGVGQNLSNSMFGVRK